MFTPPATFSVVVSVLFRLLHDEISIVRHKAAKYCGLIINRLAKEEDVDWSEQLISRILGLGRNSTYKIRLTFVHICECLVKQIPSELFLASFLDTLLSLSRDQVANIRVAVARLCRMPYPKWLAADARVVNALKEMEHGDCDRDVIWFSKSRTEKSRDEEQFCNYEGWVPRETRLKKAGAREAGGSEGSAEGCGEVVAWGDLNNSGEKAVMADESESVNGDPDTPPSCPGAHRSTIEVLLDGDKDGAQAGKEGKKSTTANDILSLSSTSAMSVAHNGRGRRESALSAGSEVEL